MKSEQEVILENHRNARCVIRAVHHNRERHLDHGRIKGLPVPLYELGFVFMKDNGIPEGWSGAYIRFDDGPDEVADALERIADQLRKREYGALGDDIRFGNEVNHAHAAALLVKLVEPAA